jgi:hypothetical protein
VSEGGRRRRATSRAPVTSHNDTAGLGCWIGMEWKYPFASVTRRVPRTHAAHMLAWRQLIGAIRCRKLFFSVERAPVQGQLQMPFSSHLKIFQLVALNI